MIRAFNQDKPYDQFLKEQIAGDELDKRTDDTLIATGFLRAGPRVAFREKDNPERRYEYLDDLIDTTSRGVLGLTVRCARCHNHKFDPIPQKDYYSLVATFFGYVETSYSLAPRADAQAHQTMVKAIESRQAVLKAEIKKIEAPYVEKLRQDAYKQFPEKVQQAIAKPERERTSGNSLLAQQVIEQINPNGRAIDRVQTPDEAARKKALTDRIAALEKEKPAPLPEAEIVTDGDYRFAPNGDGDEVIGCPKCRVSDATSGSFLHTGAGRYQVPPSYFLIRGDANAKGSLMKPGFVTVATYGNPPIEIPPADGHTSGRRRALAEWLASASNPLTARVMVNRIWHHHFGRGIVPTLDNFGKMGEPPTHPALVDYLAVEFMHRGWSIKQLLTCSAASSVPSRNEVNVHPRAYTSDALDHAGDGPAPSGAICPPGKTVFICADASLAKLRQRVTLLLEFRNRPGTPGYESMCVAEVQIGIVSELCHIPPETPGQHRHLRGHAESHRCCRSC